MVNHERVGMSYGPRLEHASLPECSQDDSFHDAEAKIMTEVADWLQSQHFDDFWKPKADPSRKVVFSFPRA